MEARARRGAIVTLGLVLALALPGAAQTPSLTVELLTWHVVGLDSNRVTTGPNVFPQGVRVCNNGTAPAVNVTARWVWDSANALINLEVGDTVTRPGLAAGECADFYFNIVITRDAAAYDTTRRFHIEVSADGLAAVSTQQPREIYVERLLSQSRNSVVSITGPATVLVGQTFQVTETADTAPNGYEQLITFIDFNQSMFRVDRITVTYGTPPGTFDDPYADACTWDPDPLSATYRSCLGTGKAGGTITMVYTLTVIGAGTQVASGLILDFSGSSYHYNADYQQDPNNRFTITAINPEADLSITKTHAPDPFVVGGTGTYTFSVTNAGPLDAAGPVTFSDELPAGVTFVSGGGSGVDCSVVGQQVTCTKPDGLAVGATVSFPIAVEIGPAAVPQVTNVVTVSSPTPDPEPADNTATDVVTVVAPDLQLSKSHAGSFLAGSTGTYTLSVTNAGTAAATGVTVVDDLPAGFTFQSASGTGWSCAASGQRVTCSQAATIAPGASSTIQLVVAVASTASGTITNQASVSGPGEADTLNNAASDPTVIEGPSGGPAPGGIVPQATATTVPPPTTIALASRGSLPVSGSGGLGTNFMIGIVLVSVGSFATTWIGRSSRALARADRDTALAQVFRPRRSSYWLEDDR